MKIVDVKEAAKKLGISVRVLEAHLQRIGPFDEQGRPYYRMTPGRGKRLFSEEQLEMIWESLPPGVEVPNVKITMPHVERRGRRRKKAGSNKEFCATSIMLQALEPRLERERKAKMDTKELERYVNKLRKELREKEMLKLGDK